MVVRTAQLCRSRGKETGQGQGDEDSNREHRGQAKRGAHLRKDPKMATMDSHEYSQEAMAADMATGDTNSAHCKSACTQMPPPNHAVHDLCTALAKLEGKHEALGAREMEKPNLHLQDEAQHVPCAGAIGEQPGWGSCAGHLHSKQHETQTTTGHAQIGAHDTRGHSALQRTQQPQTTRRCQQVEMPSGANYGS